MQPSTATVLLNRLLDSHRDRRRIVFLVGSGLTLPPAPGQPGVPGAGEIVKRVIDQLQASGAELSAGNPEPLGYQEALELYRQHRGQRGLDELVREAVLEACNGGDPQEIAAARGGDFDACRRLERTPGAWALPPGVEALGRLIADCPDTFGTAVLTTNFDPLVEVAIRKAGGQYHTSFLAEDGRISTRYGDGCHVIHVHGLWSGEGFTAHTVGQLTRPRPQLRRNLERFLEYSDLVVLGYGGWRDVFSEVITSIVIDPAQHTEVLWCFYEAGWEEIEKHYTMNLERLAPGLDTVVVPYVGIDGNRFLPWLAEASNMSLEKNFRTASIDPPLRFDFERDEGPEVYGDLLPDEPNRVPEPVSDPDGDYGIPLDSELQTASILTSPFLAGPPITTDADFFGRWQQRAQIVSALGRCQPVQILGERRMGKTSLLYWVERHADEHLPDWPVVWVDAGALAERTPAGLIGAIGESLGEENAASEGRQLEDLLPLVLLIDEAAALAAPGHGFDAAFLGLLRAAGQSHRLMWISTSHANLQGLFQEDHLTSPFLNDSVKLQVGSLEAKAANDLLAQGLGQRKTLTALAEAGQLAYPLQWIADALFRGQEPTRVADEMREALEPTFDSWWRWRSDDEKRLLIACVGEVALVGLSDQDRRILRRLVDRGLVDEKADRFTLPGAAWRDFVAEHEDG